ncbi:MAG: FkbM family methyltransferase [Pseudomonadota bacterium]
MSDGWRGETVTLSGVTMPLDTDLMRGGVLTAMRDGSYERGEVTALAALLKPGDRVLDLGSGFGLTATFAAKSAGVDRVVTFDANPRVAPHLARMQALNGVAFEARQGVLIPGRRAGTRRFFLRPLIWGSSLSDQAAIAGTPVEVLAHPAAPLMHDLRPSLISCDIEGAEVDLLPRLDLSGVRALVIEQHPQVVGARALGALRAHLRRAGFAPRPDLAHDDVEAYVRAAPAARPLRLAWALRRAVTPR